MTISLIVAHDLDGIIGRDGALPWHLPDDMRRFRALTLGSAVLMGRKTFKSLGGRLSGRFNFVLSRDTTFRDADVRVELSLDVLTNETWAPTWRNLFVIGGAEVYEAALPFCTRAYVTRVHARTTGDALTRFPCDLSGWRVIESEKRTPSSSSRWSARDVPARKRQTASYHRVRRRPPASRAPSRHTPISPGGMIAAMLAGHPLRRRNSSAVPLIPFSLAATLRPTSRPPVTSRRRSRGPLCDLSVSPGMIVAASRFDHPRDTRYASAP